MRTHTRTDQTEFADAVVELHRCESDFLLDCGECTGCSLAFGLRQCERDVGETGCGGGHVLHDHVDVDLRIGKCTEDCSRVARAIRYANNGDLRFAAVMCNARDDWLFHVRSYRTFLRDPSALFARERRAHMDREIKTTCVFNATQMQHLCSGCCEFKHFFVCHGLELACKRDDAGISGEDAVDIGIDLTYVGVECCSKCNRSCVTASATKRGDVLRFLRDTLEAGNDCDCAFVDCFTNTTRRDVDDACLAVDCVGDHTGLRTGEGTCLGTKVVDGHCEQRHRDALTCREQHVEFARLRKRRYRVREVDELVSGVAHCRNHDDHVVSGALRFDDALGHPLDRLGIGNGGAAVLLDDHAH